ncbi:GDSL esterase/lipase 5-like [Chenopodium quinoa]|uniref:GDSL esterase/lipase 5-like n=1 Tax=Chenopodium quinoa TaxID=63459 RepID=UPI000B781E75|nr:GDSL esterase/lipase 5-like [Chenopodium quinoa]
MLLESLIPLLYVLLISFPSNINCLILSHHHHHKHHPRTSLFIFGDSILDVGNNNYINTTTLDQANFWPYGVNFFHYPTGRFSDGRVISDFIAERANLPLIQPYLQPHKRRFYYGVNFASAGGGALVETFKGSVIDLHMQLKNYKKVKRWFKNKLGEKKAKRKLQKAVYFFGIGTNDYISLFLTNSSTRFTYTKSQYVSMVISNITSVVNDIYKIGGRKFGFLNLAPVGCLPALRILNSEGDGGCHKEVTSYIRLHNEAVLQGLKELEKQLPGFKYALFDYYTSTLQRVNHPSKYGYKEGKTACCGTGKFRGVLSCGGKRPVKEYELCNNVDDHIFWDSLHYTEKANKQIVDEIWSNKNYVLDDSHHSSYTINNLFHLP